MTCEFLHYTDDDVGLRFIAALISTPTTAVWNGASGWAATQVRFHYTLAPSILREVKMRSSLKLILGLLIVLNLGLFLGFRSPEPLLASGSCWGKIDDCKCFDWGPQWSCDFYLWEDNCAEDDDCPPE